MRLVGGAALNCFVAVDAPDDEKGWAYRNCGTDGETRAAGFLSLSCCGVLFAGVLRLSILISVLVIVGGGRVRNGDCWFEYY
jgi:hypothetical protein